MPKGAFHGGKGPRKKRKTLAVDPAKKLVKDHMEWMEAGGRAIYEKDFSDAPIAKMFGMPYRPLLSRYEVARLARGNSGRDRCPEPQDGSVGNPDGGSNPSDSGTGR